MKKSPTELVVGLLALGWLLFGLWLILPVIWFLFAATVLGYEFYTIFNKFPNDTISEIVWKYRKRTIIPLMCGVAIGAATMSGKLGDPQAVSLGLALGGLASHFFFPPEQAV